MTNKEKKAYLGRYLELVAEEKELLEEIAYWMSRAQKVTTAWSIVPGGKGRSDKIQNGAIKLDELHEMLKDKADNLAQIRIEIERAIGTVEDGTQRRLLRLRYIQGMTWEQIAVRMDYSYVHICRLHGQALEKIVL